MELVTFDRSLETLQGLIGRAIDGSRSAAFTTKHQQAFEASGEKEDQGMYF